MVIKMENIGSKLAIISGITATYGLLANNRDLFFYSAIVPMIRGLLDAILYVIKERKAK